MSEGFLEIVTRFARSNVNDKASLWRAEWQ
jgi:hypothetical protein